jgi:DNA-binding CsgD family transcriptional regulator
VIRLSATDLAAVAGASRVLLSPLAYETVEAWQSAATRAVREVLGGDAATMVLPVSAGGRGTFSEDLPSETTGQYVAAIRTLDVRWSAWERQAALGVWDRPTLWGPWMAEYLASAYYNEYLVPRRLYDGVGVATSVASPGTAAAEATTAVLLFHHTRRTGRRFGARGLGLLHALRPAFVAGAEALARLGAQRAALARTLDALGLAMLVVDVGGRAVHRTPALTRLLEDDPQGARLVGAMAQAATAAAQTIAPGAPAPSTRPASSTTPARNVAQEVRTPSGRYRVRATLTAPDLLGGAPAVLVILERAGPGVPTADALRARFGLTPAQARVALLLAQGHSYADAAAALGISVHTARHHAEAVRAKLGVRGHAGVAAAILDVR